MLSLYVSPSEKRDVMRNALESKYQSCVVKKLRKLFPGSLVLLTDPNHMQGIPDIVMLWRETWAALECKAYQAAPEQPNQGYYVDLMDSMSFAAFINPENEEDVLDALQRTLRSRRPARVSQRQQVSLGKLHRRQAS